MGKNKLKISSKLKFPSKRDELSSHEKPWRRHKCIRLSLGKGVHAVWFQPCDTLEKENTETVTRSPAARSAVGRSIVLIGGTRSVFRAAGILCIIRCLCPNPQKAEHQERTLMWSVGVGRWRGRSLPPAVTDTPLWRGRGYRGRLCLCALKARGKALHLPLNFAMNLKLL